MGNKVVFGFEKVHIAVMEDDTSTGAPKYKKPVYVPGAVSFSPSPDSQENTFFAENMKYHTSYSNNGKKGDLVMALFPDELLADIYGWLIDEIGGLIQTTTAVQKRFALLAQMQGDQLNRRFVLYGCSSSIPSISYETTNDTSSPKTASMSITAAPVKLPGDLVVVQYDVCNTQKAKTVYDKFFDSVYFPTPKASPPAEPEVGEGEGA